MRTSWIIFIFLGSLVNALAIDVSWFGERPQEAIYDPAGWIKGPEKSLIARELASIKETSGLDILVVVTEDPREKDRQLVAEELANRWGDYGGRALILCEPGNYESPWIAVSGLIRSEISRGVLETMIEKSRQRARASDTVAGGVRAVIEILGDDLRFASGRAARGLSAPPGKSPPPGMRQMLFYAINHSKAVIGLFFAATLAAFLLIYGGVRIWKKARKTMFPKAFPEISWKPRFGAPYAGIVYTHSKKPQRHHHD